MRASPDVQASTADVACCAGAVSRGAPVSGLKGVIVVDDDGAPVDQADVDIEIRSKTVEVEADETEAKLLAMA